MLQLPIATILLIVEKEELTALLKERNALQEGEVAVKFTDLQAMVTKIGVKEVRRSVDTITLAAEILSGEAAPEISDDTISKALELARKTFPAKVIFAHCLYIDNNGKKIINISIPAYVDANISHVIDIEGRRSLVDIVRSTCEPHFTVEHKENKSIRVLPKS